MKKRNVYVAMMILFFFTTCKKVPDTPQLPPITHNGIDMIAFKVDNNAVVMYDQWFVPLSFYNVYMKPFEINGSISAPDCDIGLSFQYNDSLGTYPISTFFPYAWFTDNTHGSLTHTKYSASYSTDSIHTGTVTIIYYDGKEVAGYFHFDAISDSGVVVHITDGRFDIYKH